MVIPAETDARSLISAVVLIVLIGLLGMVLVIGLMVAWRRSLERHRSRVAHADDAPDAWQEAARRLTETDDDPTQGDDADDNGRDNNDQAFDEPEDPFGRNR